jgi:hypothetical protein
VYVKNRLSGFACLIALCCAAPLAAQQTPPAQAPPPQSPPQSEAQPPDTQAPPPQSSPQGEAQPASDEAPVLPGKLPLPPVPKVVDIRMPGERGFSIGLGGWSLTSHVSLLKGRAAATEYPGDLGLNSARKFGENVDFAIAAGLHNIVRVTADVDRASGSTFAPTDLVLWNRQYNPGNYITTGYRMRHVKVSFEYLTWPYPVKTSRFRLRSLWQIQYVDLQSTLDAPLNPTVDANGNPLVDASGNLVGYDASGSKWFLLPSIGLGMQEYLTRGISLEINGSGFLVPHHANVWDADAAANIRIGHYELRLGAKAFHFQTSFNADFVMRGTLFGPFIGLRWHSDGAK